MKNEEVAKIICQVITENPQLEMSNVVINEIKQATEDCIVANLSYTWRFQGYDKSVKSDRWFINKNGVWKCFL